MEPGDQVYFFSGNKNDIHAPVPGIVVACLGTRILIDGDFYSGRKRIAVRREQIRTELGNSGGHGRGQGRRRLPAKDRRVLLTARVLPGVKHFCDNNRTSTGRLIDAAFRIAFRVK